MSWESLLVDPTDEPAGRHVHGTQDAAAYHRLGVRDVDTVSGGNITTMYHRRPGCFIRLRASGGAPKRLGWRLV